jgi:hypothetical protein
MLPRLIAHLIVLSANVMFLLDGERFPLAMSAYLLGVVVIELLWWWHRRQLDYELTRKLRQMLREDQTMWPRD